MFNTSKTIVNQHQTVFFASRKVSLVLMINKTLTNFYRIDPLVILLALAILLGIFNLERQKQKLVVKAETSQKQEQASSFSDVDK